MFLGRIALFPIPGLKDIPTRNASIATFIDNENLSLNPLVISYQDENEVHFDSFTSCKILLYILFFISNLFQLNEFEFVSFPNKCPVYVDIEGAPLFASKTEFNIIGKIYSFMISSISKRNERNNGWVFF